MQKLARGKIDGDLERDIEARLPLLDLIDRRPHHPIAELHDESRGFGLDDEGLGWSVCCVALRPAAQGFGSHDRAGREFDDRLIERLKLAIAERIGKALVHRKPVTHARSAFSPVGRLPCRLKYAIRAASSARSVCTKAVSRSAATTERPCRSITTISFPLENAAAHSSASSGVPFLR